MALGPLWSRAMRMPSSKSSAPGVPRAVRPSGSRSVTRFTLPVQMGCSRTSPTYPFQRKRYWLSPSLGRRDLTTIGQSSSDHPLLRASIALAGDGGWLFTGRVSRDAHPWLADHVVLDSCVIPGAAFAELASHV